MFPPVRGWEIILSARQSHVQCNPCGPHIFVQRQISPSIRLVHFFVVAKSVYYLRHALRLSVRPSVCINAILTGRLSFIFDTGGLLSKCVEKLQIWVKSPPPPKCRALYIKIQMCFFFVFSYIFALLKYVCAPLNVTFLTETCNASHRGGCRFFVAKNVPR